MAAEVKKEIQLEIAHVLFTDIVGYSKLPINQQRASVQRLNEIVRGTDAYQAAETAGRLMTIPTGDGSQVSLKDYRGKWVVLYFYPKDFTSGCTMEARNFQRDLAKYSDAGVVILGVSVDTAQSHKDFCAKERLNFKLLADPDAKVSTEYGSVMDYKGQKLASRNTFIINPNGDIAKVYTGVKPADHSEQVLKDLAALKKS